MTAQLPRMMTKTTATRIKQPRKPLICGVEWWPQWGQVEASDATSFLQAGQGAMVATTSLLFL
jgi:hypothetical protein